ncbi:melanophilin, partial [Erinaceus europaeus]|uniref:Melanophilin n=1 Tax=Erinaceus europaeus TaxID=9365 RepID=A0ABM3WVT4_ERIEU
AVRPSVPLSPRGLKEEVQKQSTQREQLGGPPGEPHCACCLRPFRLLSAPPHQCQGCPLVTCEGCGRCHPEGQDWLCDPCHLARAGKTGSLDWFYGHLRARFRSFGSAKVIRSLSQRLRAGEPQPSSGERDGDREQLAVDGEGDLGAQPQPPGSSTTKRRLSVHGLDEQLDSDDSANSWGSLPSPRRDPGATGSPQPSAGEPSSKETTSQDTLVPKEANPWEAAGPADLEQQTDTFTPTGQDVTLDPPRPPRIPAPEGAAARPGTAALSAECPPAPNLGELPSSDGHGTCEMAALRVAPQPATHGTQLALDSQVPGLSRRLSAVDRLLTRLEQVVAAPPAQGPADFATSEANLEEEALRMKLQQLTSHISDQGSSSEEEDKEDGVQPGGAPVLTEPPRGAPEGSPEAVQACGREWTTDQELSRLEDRVATAASEVQQAKAEVSHIQSRIAALQAAGLTVRPSATPRRRRSNLPIFLPRLAGTLGQRPQDPCADSPEGEVRSWAGSGARPPRPQEHRRPELSQLRGLGPLDVLRGHRGWAAEGWSRPHECAGTGSQGQRRLSHWPPSLQLCPLGCPTPWFKGPYAHCGEQAVSPRTRGLATRLTAPRPHATKCPGPHDPMCPLPPCPHVPQAPMSPCPHAPMPP